MRWRHGCHRANRALAHNRSAMSAR
jgi:hypothetical protein